MKLSECGIEQLKSGTAVMSANRRISGTITDVKLNAEDGDALISITWDNGMSTKMPLHSLDKLSLVI
jgi:hypothetical protein